MNIEDFIDSLQLDQMDVEETGRLGYVEGISRIFMNKLNELDMYSRPLHCTDLKRETLYIKEDDRWEKDNENKDKLQSIVEKVANKNYEQLPIWQQQNPNHLVTNTSECELFMDIACNILGGGNEQETLKFRSQIMRNVLKEVTLEKMS
jgi:bifunctional DNA-binding transcriptional regulator/antitoxin component of YhaV-PrlF toxin-antitoxin module